jgi:hypothetical protein
MKNVGEFDEMRIKLRLIELRDSQEVLNIGSHSIKISSVKMQKEFLPIPIGTDLRKMTDIDIENLANCVGAAKAPTGSKADVIINNIGFSVKSHRSAPPAIVNHTPRWGWFRICREIGVDIAFLDEMVVEYFNKRASGILKEDVANDNPMSPFVSHKEYLRPILNYFLFTGTGTGVSKFPAKFVLDCGDPYDISTWQIHDESDYLDLYWDKLVFSMRNKGFESYPYTRESDLWKNDECSLWAREFDGALKGSLHVRVK